VRWLLRQARGRLAANADHTEAFAAQPQRRPRRRGRRLVVIGLGTIAFTYVAVCAAVFLAQAKLIYLPSRTYNCTPAEFGLPYEEVRLTAADGVSIVAWFLAQPSAKGTVLFCHGNAENLADGTPTLKAWHRLGYSVLAFDYRGYGHSAGAPSEAGIYLDAAAAWQYLVENRHESPARIILFGRSLGGAVAIEMAREHPPGALIVEGTFTSLVDIGQREYPLLPVSLLCRHRYESIRKVPLITCPKLFLHGSADELIPLDNARLLFATAAKPKTFIETPGGHNSAGFEHNWECTQRVADWLSCVLPTTSAPSATTRVTNGG
jgi:fermentation-respiration switch protein FrsA (DUF1100 family)